MEATVVMAKCNISKESFGIRAEKQINKWVFNWAFKLSEKAATNEGYNETTISGAIAIASEYPGCPHCGGRGTYVCGHCKKAVCLKGEETEVTCPHCGNKGKLVASETVEGLKGGAL